MLTTPPASAPAQNSPSGAPSAPPAGAPQAKSPASTTPGGADGGQDSDLRPGKPIAPIKKGLPGVIPRLSRAEQAARDGKPADSPSQDAKTTPDGAPSDGAEPKTEPKTEVFRIGTREFESAEAAAKHLAKLERENHISKADQSKLGKELAQLRKQVAQLTAQPPSPQPQTPPSVDPTSDEALGLDAELIQYHKDVAEAEDFIDAQTDPAEKKRLRAELRFNMQQFESRRQQKMFDALLESKFGNLLQVDQQIQFSTRADAAFDVVASELSDPQNPESAPAYPELYDQVATGMIARAWDKMNKSGIPEAVTHHPNFIKLMVYAYRGQRMAQTQAAPAAPPAAPPVLPKPPIPAPPTAPAVATATGFPPSSTPRATPTSQASRYPGQRLPGVVPR